jgi:hypothetical protein
MLNPLGLFAPTPKPRIGLFVYDFAGHLLSSTAFDFRTIRPQLSFPSIKSSNIS